MVEHLKVMAASRACFRIQLTYLVGGAMVERLRTLSVEPPKGSLTVEPAFASLSVEHLKVMAALTVEPASASLLFCLGTSSHFC